MHAHQQSIINNFCSVKKREREREREREGEGEREKRQQTGN